VLEERAQLNEIKIQHEGYKEVSTWQKQKDGWDLTGAFACL
jgi:hypothetical protein